MKEEFERISKMTDAEAAEVLKRISFLMHTGRKNGKVLLSLEIEIALKRAIEALEKAQSDGGKEE